MYLIHTYIIVKVELYVHNQYKGCARKMRSPNIIGTIQPPYRVARVLMYLYENVYDVSN